MNKEQLINNIASLADKWEGLTTEKQEDKVFEEYIELIEAKESGNIEEIKKELADVIITMVVLDRLRGGFNVDAFVKCVDLISGSELLRSDINDDLIIYIVTKLNQTATQYNLNVWECLEYKYNIVANRKGEVVDGTFVKDSE